MMRRFHYLYVMQYCQYAICREQLFVRVVVFSHGKPDENQIIYNFIRLHSVKKNTFLDNVF